MILVFRRTQEEFLSQIVGLIPWEIAVERSKTVFWLSRIASFGHSNYMFWSSQMEGMCQGVHVVEWAALTELKCEKHSYTSGREDGLHGRKKHFSNGVEEPNSAGTEICGGWEGQQGLLKQQEQSKEHVYLLKRWCGRPSDAENRKGWVEFFVLFLLVKSAVRSPKPVYTEARFRPR